MIIPQKFVDLIARFLDAKKIGHVVLHVHDGNILRLELNETVKLN